MIHLIFGAPGAGKTTLACDIVATGGAEKLVSVDMFNTLPWSEQSAAIVGALLLADMSPSTNWVFEGFGLARGVRKLYESGNKLYTVGDTYVLRTGRCDRWKPVHDQAVMTVISSCEPLLNLVSKTKRSENF